MASPVINPSSVYDATKPYTPPEGVNESLPPITPPPTNPLGSQNQDQNKPQAPNVLPNKGGKAAGIAYMLDSVLKGAMKGREQAQQKQAYKLNRLMQGFGYAYKSASDQYLGMLQNSPDLGKKLGELDSITKSKTPTPEQQKRAQELSSDPDVVKAQSISAAADSAWQAQQRIYGNYLNPDQKKSKSSKSKGGDQSKAGGAGGQGDDNPIQLLQSQNPQEKLKGYFLIQQKVGPRYKREAQYYMSPEYQQSRSNMAGQQQLEGANTQDELELRNLRSQPASTERDQKISAIESRMPNKDADKIRGERNALAESYKAAGMSEDDANKQAAKDLTSKYGGKPHVVTKPEPDKNSPTGFSWVSKDAITGEEYSREQNALPPRGMVPTESDTNTTDPYGNVSHSHNVRKPILGPQGTPTAPTAAPTASGTPPAASGPVSVPAAASSSANPKRQRNIAPLDDGGHIPSSAGNPLVVEAANQLLDGTDKEKLPTKAREPAAALARKYGWQQGKFTPKEQTMLKESTTFIDEAMKNPSLSVLDGDYTDRLKLAQVLKSPDKEGMLQSAVSVAAAQNLSKPQAEFVRMYNQLVGTISGLGQLVRSGRITEATVDRLKTELPNPTTTKDSADGKKRLQRLRQEIDIAMEKGTFEGKTDATPSGSQGSGGKIIYWKKDAQGNPVPDTSRQ